MLELLLIRHGQTDYNAKRKVMGRLPIPLNVAGHEQAEKLAERLDGEGLHAILTSPVLRARQTSEVIAAKQNGVAVEDAEALAELDYGDWVDMDIDEVTADNPEAWATYRSRPHEMRFPGGESLADASARIGSFLNEVSDRFDDGMVALVSHADVIKMALLHLLGLPLKHLANISIDNCSISMVRMAPDTGPRLVMLSGFDGVGMKAHKVDSEVRP